MQHVLEVLFPYIALLYIFDCIIIVKNHHVLLVSLFGDKFNLKKTGIHFVGLLPTSQTIVSHNIPIVYTQEGIYVVFDKSYSNSEIYRVDDFDFIHFKDLYIIEVEGKNIHLNNKHIIKTPSSLCANLTANFLIEIRNLKPLKRIEKIRVFLSNSFDLGKLKKLKSSYTNNLYLIKLLSSCLFVLVFLILPMVLYSNLYYYINLHVLIIYIFLVYLTVLIITFSTDKKIHKTDKKLRAYNLMSIIFSPVNAIHAINYLTKDLYTWFDYLTIAAFFMPSNSFKKLVRKEFFLIDYHINANNNKDWTDFWELKKALLLNLLKTHKISVKDIFEVLPKKDHTAIFYCPYCMTEYRKNLHKCIDCQVALKKF